MAKGHKRTREEWEALLEEFPAEHADLLLSVSARIRQSIYGGGPAKLLKSCPKCGEKFGAREMRSHLRTCGAHLVSCRHGCGYTGNPLGVTLHEKRYCEKNPKAKKAVQ